MIGIFPSRAFWKEEIEYIMDGIQKFLMYSFMSFIFFVGSFIQEVIFVSYAWQKNADDG